MFDLIIDRNNKVTEAIQMIKSSGKPVAVYGAGYSGGECCEALEGLIKYVCDDDPQKIGTVFYGFTIISPESLPIDDDYYIIIANGFIDAMQRRLSSLGLADKYLDVDFGRYDKERENYVYYSNNRERVEKAFELLADDKSREVFVRMINYKIHRDRQEILGIVDSEQYFDSDVMPINDSEVFVDLGAFNGDTIRAFLQKTQAKYDKIIALEPSKRNYDELLKTTESMRNVLCFNNGAWSENTELLFEVPDSKNSYVSDRGTERISVVKLDDVLEKNGAIPTLIKADIEGAEKEAIIGMRRTISMNTPKLALCVYHDTEDIFEIPLMINAINSGYDFYLRQYAPSSIETVLYCIPNRNI